MTAALVDRSGCAARKHGDANAYQNHRCRCPDARNAVRVYVKKRQLARLRGHAGRAGMVPTWRVTRRFQALARMGYSARDVQTAAWGWKRSNGTQSWQAKATMGPTRFARLDAVYQAWSATPGSNWRAQAWAKRRNWSAPFDWDNIDDPDEIPYNRRKPL